MLTVVLLGAGVYLIVEGARAAAIKSSPDSEPQWYRRYQVVLGALLVLLALWIGGRS